MSKTSEIWKECRQEAWADMVTWRESLKAQLSPYTYLHLCDIKAKCDQRVLRLEERVDDMSDRMNELQAHLDLLSGELTEGKKQ